MILENLRIFASNLHQMNYIIKKHIYETPVVEVMEAKVEKGFMGSGSGSPNIPDGEHGTQPLTEGETLFL